MRYFDTFAGVGGFGIGIQAAMPDAECVGSSEIDRHASDVLAFRHPLIPNHGDITKIDWEKIPDFDLLTGGVPCQAWSIAGKRGGFADPRGGMWAEFQRALWAKTPRFFIAENVKGLLSHDGGRSFGIIKTMLEEAGYELRGKVLNAKDYGVPQRRERVFIVGFRNGDEAERFKWPDAIGSKPRVADILEENVPESYYLKPQSVEKLLMILAPGMPLDHHTVLRWQNTKTGVVADTVSPTLRASHGSGGWSPRKMPVVIIREATKKGYAIAEPGDVINLSVPNSKTRRGRVGAEGQANTLDTSCNQAVVLFKNGELRLRRLTPIECERLQGWPDGWTGTSMRTGGKATATAYPIPSTVSDSHRYRMVGNGVAAPVVRAIAAQIALTVNE